MAFLLAVDKVKYQCACGGWLPLCRLYFCRYCVELRCASCTQHEADVYYCPQCLQSQMAPEAKLHDMSCRTCFECPSCQSVLALRAVAGPKDGSTIASTTRSDDLKSAPASPAAKKKYYLFCGYCHWSTKDVGIEEREITVLHDSFTYEESGEIKALREAYQLVGVRDAAERRVTKVNMSGGRRKNLASLALRDDLTAQLLIGKNSTSPRSKQLASVSVDSVLSTVKSEPTGSIDELSEDFFTQPLDLSKVTTMEQRLRNVRRQQSDVKQFVPNRKRLSIKKSIRCKKCDHSLCKPEFGTMNIRFKIQLLAQLQLPELRITPGYKLVVGQVCPIVISVSNPDQLSPISFKLVSFDDNKKATAKVTVPSVEFTLEPKNEAFSLDESMETAPDQKEFLQFNYGSKVGVKCTILVTEPTQNAIVSVIMSHIPVTVNEQETEPMRFPVLLNFGSTLDQ